MAATKKHNPYKALLAFTRMVDSQKLIKFIDSIAWGVLDCSACDDIANAGVDTGYDENAEFVGWYRTYEIAKEKAKEFEKGRIMLDFGGPTLKDDEYVILRIPEGEEDTP